MYVEHNVHPFHVLLIVNCDVRLICMTECVFLCVLEFIPDSIIYLH